MPVCVCVSRVWVCLCVYAQSTGHMVCVSNLCPFILTNCSHGTNDDKLAQASGCPPQYDASGGITVVQPWP